MNATLKHDVNGLIEANRSYAHAIAAEALRTLASNADRDDIRGAAELGLVEAARSFDPARGVSFKTFAYYRIRGSIYDGLRKTLGRADESRLRFETAANEYLGECAATPLAGGSAENDLDQLTEITGALMSVYLVSLDQSEREIADEDGLTPEEIFEQSENSRRVREAIAGLPERNRLLIEDYYFHDLSMEEIGRKMGLSKSWVCRLHAKSIEMLRGVLNGGSTRASVATFSSAAR